MKLTQPVRRGKSVRQGARTPTTEPGFLNPNRQVVERRTGSPSLLRQQQTVYAIRCRDCGHVYGCNGLDIKERRCPGCQGGAPGEPLQEQMPSLFNLE